MSNQYVLKYKEWVTVGGYAGFFGKKLCFSINTDKKCSWRRLGLFPGWGRFQKKTCQWIFNGVIQVKAYDKNVLCKSWFV